MASDQQSFVDDRPPIALPPQKPVFSENGNAALFSLPIRATGDSTSSSRAMDDIRGRVSGEKGGLTVKVTGAAGYGADAIKVFGNINGTLLGVTALIVLILLVIIYRSPIFWAIPFFTVLLAESCARGFGYLIAEAGVTINGQSGGILPVLVFGAGTDYALLLVSRYREELRRHEDKHEAMTVALGTAGPAILASGLTVIIALLTLSLAEVNGTAGLGPIGAMGVGIAMISMLTMLPALLVICGRKRPGRRSSTRSRTSANRARTRPTAAAADRRARGREPAPRLGERDAAARRALARCDPDRHGPDQQQLVPRGGRVGGGGRDPRALVPERPLGAHQRDRPDRAKAPAVRQALLERRDLVAQVLPPQQGPPGTRFDVVLTRDPFSTAAFDQVPALRKAVKAAGGSTVLVGGPTAEAYDYRKSASRDNFVVLPLALIVVLVILAILLRALLAPILLVASVILSFFAALGRASSSSSTSSGSPASTRRCRCSRSCSWSRWGSTTTSS